MVRPHILGMRAGIGILVAVVVANVASVIGHWLVSFEAGKSPASFASRNIIGFLVLTLIPYAVVCLAALIALISLVALWPSSRASAKWCLAVACCASLAGVVILVGQPPGYVPFTQGLAVFAKSHVDVPAFREWAAARRHDTCGSIAQSEWPSFIQDLRPAQVEIERDAQQQAIVRVWWGGGGGHWGITVGADNLQSPTSESGRFLWPVEPGMYAWHEVQ